MVTILLIVIAILLLTGGEQAKITPGVNGRPCRSRGASGSSRNR